ncbi:MAG: hypothetical protein N3B10_11665 [Armatimonadetes bacterium]|nr:hypothetical protein [Armatimonadota bacterium]MCX7969124.1 hypothetical protein [Armatimonadota bacterium]MDW8142227.1 hypothetical protein [Armatimonadota bacterium]
MERLLAELVAQCTRNPSLGGMLVWVSLVTIVVWSPYLLPQRLSGFAIHLFGYGMVGILAERLIHLTTSSLPSLPLMELTALGLTAVVVWVEAMKRKHEKDERKLSWQKEQYRDWSTAARLALWATLTLMPAVRWV